VMCCPNKAEYCSAGQPAVKQSTSRY